MTNTGSRAGATVAQVYVADTHASVPRPAKELKGFEKVLLKPGEKRHVTVPLDGRSFAYYDTEAKGWHIAPGEFTVLVGQSSADPELKGTLTISEASAKAAIE